MHRDPLMPVSKRFPFVDSGSAVGQDDAAGSDRPFVLRAWEPVPPSELPQCRHRTPATQRTIPRQTGRDNVFDDDSYTVPDD